MRDTAQARKGMQDAVEDSDKRACVALTLAVLPCLVLAGVSAGCAAAGVPGAPEQVTSPSQHPGSRAGTWILAAPSLQTGVDRHTNVTWTGAAASHVGGHAHAAKARPQPELLTTLTRGQPPVPPPTALAWARVRFSNLSGSKQRTSTNASRPRRPSMSGSVKQSNYSLHQNQTTGRTL